MSDQELPKRTWAEVDLDAVAHNYKVLCSMSNARVMPVIKADGYGHGAVAIAGTLKLFGAKEFGVSSIDEAMQLRLNGIGEPILIFGYTPESFASLLAAREISQTVFDVEYAKRLSTAALSAGVVVGIHIKVDTGMSRLGIAACPENIDSAAEAVFEISRLNGLHVSGIFTHFATAGEDDVTFLDRQYKTFSALLEKLEGRGLHIPIKHCANSAGLLYNSETAMDMVRAGIAIYGMMPNGSAPDKYSLIPAMRFKSVISQIKNISKGDSVSYGRTFVAPKDMRIAVLPVGYADGYLRAFSNGRGQVEVRGKRAGVVGTVCMDMTMIDLTKIPEASPGDEVTLFGDGAQSVNELARAAGTINYEIVCLVGKRVPRVYLRDGKPCGQLNYIVRT